MVVYTNHIHLLAHSAGELKLILSGCTDAYKNDLEQLLDGKSFAIENIH